MLPRVHKHIDGGHQWLSWALGRERALRASGILWAEHKYAMPDGTLIRVQTAGDDSHVWLVQSGGGPEWIAYPCKIAPAVFESAAHATTPVENRPVVEKIPFVAIPRVPYPTPPNLTFPKWPVDPPSGVGAENSFNYTWQNIGYSNGVWVSFAPGGPIRDEFGNIIGYEPGKDVPLQPQPSAWAPPLNTMFLGSARARLTMLGIQVSLPGIKISVIQVEYGDPRIQATENALYEYSVAVHTYNIEAAAANAAYAAAKAAIDAQNASIDMQNQTAYQLWLSENNAPMVAKKNVECDAWDAPKRPGRKAFMEALFTRVLAEVEAGFTTKWLTKVVLSPDYLPVGPFAPTYFIRIVSSSASFDALEQRTDTFTYSITDPDGKERRVEGSKRDIGSYGPATDCFLLNGDEYQSPFRIYELSNFWLGDPADDMRDMLPSSTSRGRGYLVTGSTPTRQDNKFLFSELNEITLPEAAAFDTSAHPPYITADGHRMLDMGFVDGCQVSIIVLRYMMWDAGANARVPVVGYTGTTSSFVCQSGNCLDSNFVSRSSPRNAANEVWLESVVTMTKTNSQWSAPIVTKHPGVFLCPIAVDNTPTKRPGGDLPGDVPYANFPDFVVVVRGMPASYGPAVNELATAFTDKFFSLDTTDSSVPPATECTTVAQMRDRITLEAIKQSNL